ncbi:P-loop containing nucleoside triphosphate hydrolase protein [Cyathus striatus]|nr:P-loop containing nucleoside triphosphate hydrolase protein [Cyathus striatus]
MRTGVFITSRQVSSYPAFLVYFTMPKKSRTWKRKEAIMKKGDALVKNGKPNDMVIVVMGPTGVGKSTFINTFFDEDVTTVGHDLKSCTSNLKHIIRPHPFEPYRRIVVVDTPGFDDTYLDDAEILRRILVWLATSYTSDMKLAGVIYLHDISKNRMLGTTLKNLYVFQKLCGDQALSSVVLATTKWSKLTDSSTGDARLDQLKTDFWKEMIEGGSEVFKFDKTRESAQEMVNYLLRPHHLDYDVLKLQEELVDLQKIIPETDAGMQLRYTLRQFVKMSKDKASQEQLQKTVAAIHALKISIPQQLKVMIGLQAAFRPSEPSGFMIFDHSNCY